MITERPNTSGDYRPHWPDVVVTMSREGSSIRAIAAELKLTMDDFWTLCEQYPEFKEAVEWGRDLARAWWEETGRRGVAGLVPHFSATSWAFQMKNRFPEEWSDRCPAPPDEPERATVDFSNLTDEELRILDKAFAGREG